MGCTVSTVRVSVAGDGTQGNASGMFHSAISADGRYVAFSSGASTLVAGDTNGFNDIFVHDRDADNDGIFDETGAGERATVRVSVDSSGAQANGISSSLNGLGMSADGRFVAFQSGASNLAPGDTNATNDIFVHDRDADNDGIFDETGAGERATLRVSVDSGGAQGNGASANTTISANGRFVSFNSAASNLVTGDTNGVTDAFVRDTCLGAVGCTPSTVRVSVAGDGTQGNTFGHAFQPVISLDGSFVTFSSDSTNLIAGDTNGQADVFLAQTCFGLP
jgi:cold shock CspA family protein